MAKKTQQEESFDISEFFMNNEDCSDDHMLEPHLFAAAAECQKTAINLVKLVLQYSGKDKFPEEEIYQIYRRALNQALTALEENMEMAE
ncbi:hypothetical protein ACFORL_12195 [Legionella dresdenensis]|uniref:Uncharacterized protein n=1 Tax=Legionella dresdenensis TaxID=450200 RepID=A0ABV8CID4_9GAMM